MIEIKDEIEIQINHLFFFISFSETNGLKLFTQYRS